MRGQRSAPLRLQRMATPRLPSRETSKVGGPLEHPITKSGGTKVGDWGTPVNDFDLDYQRRCGHLDKNNLVHCSLVSETCV